MKTFNLTIKDRLILLNVLPKEYDVASLRIIRDLENLLGITHEEKETVGLVVTDGVYDFIADKDVLKPFVLNKSAVKLVQDSFVKLDKQKKLARVMLETFEKFEEQEEEE